MEWVKDENFGRVDCDWQILERPVDLARRRTEGACGCGCRDRYPTMNEAGDTPTWCPFARLGVGLLDRSGFRRLP